MKDKTKYYPCPKCDNPSVVCGCSSSCGCGIDSMRVRITKTHTQRYCKHCEDSFWTERLAVEQNDDN